MQTGGYTISTMLDKRTKKANGKHPIKLRVFTNVPKGYFKLYGLGAEYECTPTEFKTLKQGSPRGYLKAMRDELKAIEAHATQVASSIKPFNLPKFEQALNHKQPRPETLDQAMEAIIERLDKSKRVRTSIAYQLALKSVRGYQKRERILFNEVTPSWLNGYESWMQEQGRSLTTVGIYLRALRSAFNEEIQAGRLPQASYPFGRRKYVIPAGSAVKKALTKDQLKTLVQASLEPGSYQHKARAFWLFSFLTNGMNFIDIAKLKYKDIDGDEIVFLRTKTKNTTKAKMKPIQAFLAPQAREVIEMYGNASREPENYVFPILAPGMDEKEIIKTAQNFTRLTNQHLKKLAKNIGLPDAISTNWARHTFATLSVIGGAPLEFVGAALGHENTKTTQNYFAGFPSETRRQVSEGLMQFD